MTGLRGDRQMPDALKNPPKTGFWRHTESSIRTHEAQAQTWGVNFQRTIRRRNESAYWAPLPRQFDLFRVSMAGQLTGVEAPDTLWRTLQVTPYVVGEAFRSSATSERDVDDAGRDRG